MTKATEAYKCQTCEGSGFMVIPMNSDAGIATKRCKNCNGTGVIIIDTPFSGEGEEFPDKEIFRMGTEKFDEVFEDSLIVWEIGDLHTYEFGVLIKKYFDIPKDKVKISCKPGKIIIQRLEK